MPASANKKIFFGSRGCAADFEFSVYFENGLTREKCLNSTFLEVGSWFYCAFFKFSTLHIFNNTLGGSKMVTPARVACFHIQPHHSEIGVTSHRGYVQYDTLTPIRSTKYVQRLILLVQYFGTKCATALP